MADACGMLSRKEEWLKFVTHHRGRERGAAYGHSMQMEKDEQLMIISHQCAVEVQLMVSTQLGKE